MKALPTSEFNFKTLIEDDCYYVDKTQAIEEIITNKDKVTLFPRPRRFGKSLFMSMLYNFFEIDLKKENKDLFKELCISKSEYYKELSNYPTIYLDFKDVCQENFESTCYFLKSRISEVYRKKSYVLDVLNEEEKEIFNNIMYREASLDDYKDSIKNLSMWLERYYNKKVIILIDEYDAPINEGYILNYYDEIMNIIRPILSTSLKGNDSLKFGVLTGVLRVGGESLFSKFNNLKVYDIMSEQYNEYFGFTKEETVELLNYYGLDKTSEVEDYYDGYNFGGEHIYNPFSIINYADEKKLQPYWMNTGSNKLLKELLSKVTNKEEIEKLIQGESITFTYDNSITYESFTNPDNLNNLLNLLLVTGYVTFDYEKITEDEDVINYFRIPNREVKEDFIKIMQSVIFNEDGDYVSKVIEFKNAVIEEDKEKIENIMNESLSTISYYDETEKFYHGFAFGFYSQILSNKNYYIDSNLESGKGRPDVIIERKDGKLGLVFEFKIASSESDMEVKANEGLTQASTKEYINRLKTHGVNDIKVFIIVFYEKKCIVR